MRKNEEMEMTDNRVIHLFLHETITDPVPRVFLLHSQADLMMYESCCFTPYNV